MSGLSTKDVKAIDSSGPSKTIVPGNHKLFIRDITLDQTGERSKKLNAYSVMLHLETEPMPEGFIGFFLDPKEEAKGTYKGQVGKVKTAEWPYADGTTKSGIPVSRDMDILKILKTICVAVDRLDWFEEADGKYKTIEKFVEAMVKAAPYKDVLVNFCIAGHEYLNEKTGYNNIGLSLPKFKDGVPIESLSVAKSKLLKYDESVHFKKAETTVVSNFAGDEPGAEGSVDTGTPEEFTL